MYGILRTMFDPRINLSNEVSMQLIEHFDQKSIPHRRIPRNTCAWLRRRAFGLPGIAARSLRREVRYRVSRARRRGIAAAKMHAKPA